MPLPGDDMLPETEEIPLFGSGFSFLNAPSAEMGQKFAHVRTLIFYFMLHEKYMYGSLCLLQIIFI
jgi:hypothetical protein